MKKTAGFGASILGITLVLATGTASAQLLRVDSVMVDTVWNSDSSLAGGGSRVSRDCKISFIPRGEGSALMSLSVSLDSGTTFAASKDSFFKDSVKVKNYALFSPFPAGQKATIGVRVLGGDRRGAAFKLTARQEAPVIAGNPKVKVLGPVVTAGASIGTVLGVRPAGDTTSYGYCTLAKVYWDTLGAGKYDSTAGTTWTWQTKVPAGASAQTRTVIVRAVDKNGLISAPETLTVQFGLHRQVVMKDIPAGTFSMGETGLPQALAEPVHQVSIIAFSMQETPVTQEQYLVVMGQNPSYSIGDLTRPVESVTWHDAVRYCNSLSKLSGLDTCYSYASADASDAVCDFTKRGYRLPTEAEWEYACRAGTSTTYWWGSDTAGFSQHVYYPTYNSGTTTTSVASTLPNAFGLYDMQGNGWKWCNDWFSLTYYASSPAADPRGPATGVNRVLRGGADIGSLFVLQDFYRSAYRGNLTPGVANMYTGFTCARSR